MESKINFLIQTIFKNFDFNLGSLKLHHQMNLIITIIGLEIPV